MAKCPVCNRTFEPTKEEIEKAKPFSVNLCSQVCWAKSHPGKSISGHRWEYHVGLVDPLPSYGSNAAKIDHSKLYPRDRFGKVHDKTLVKLLNL